MVLRKLFECMGIAISRLFEMNEKVTRELKEKGTHIVHSRTGSQLSENGAQNERKDHETIRTLGGCSIAEDARGIQQPHVVEPCQRCLSNLAAPLPSLKIEEEDEKWEVED